MKNRISILILLMFFPHISSATDVSGDVWGEWTAAGNPYNVVGDLRVPPGSTLVIGPGCYIEFQGYYGIDVEPQAIFRAIGTETDSVIFTPADTVSGWSGIYLLCADSGTQFSYCRIEYANPPLYRDVIRSDTSYLMVENSLFYGNKAVTSSIVISCFINNHSEISHNAFIANTPGFAVIWIADEVPGSKISDNYFEHNSAEAVIWADGTHDLYITHNVIKSNTAAPYINWETDTTFFNHNLVINNQSNFGFCVYIIDSYVDFLNNTFFGNYAGESIVCIDEEHFCPENFLRNNIFWGNTYGGYEIFSGDVGLLIVKYSDVQGGWGGAGNINTDPMFVDTANADFHLMPNSPCIDTGDPASPLDPDSTRADMGALYFDQTTGIIKPPLLPREIALHQNYPNPFNANTIIRFDLPSESRVSMDIYDLLGRRVSSIVDAYYLPGTHEISWDGLSKSGKQLPTGIYLYKLKSDTFEQTRKMMLLK